MKLRRKNNKMKKKTKRRKRGNKNVRSNETGKK